MVWGGIMDGRETDLIVIPGILNAQRYFTEVLGPVVIPCLNQNPGTLMHDNRSCCYPVSEPESWYPDA